MRRELLAVAVCATLTLVPGTGAAGPVALGVNLLDNGDAETGDTTGWTTTTIEAFDDAGRVQNGTFFFWGGTAPVATATQEVDLAPLAARIAGGEVIATLSGRLGGFSTQADHASVAVTELDGTGAVVDTFQIGPVTDTERGNATQMLFRRTTDALEPATRSLRVTLTGTRLEGTNNDGSFDDLALVLADGPPAVPAGTNLLVNGDAETGTGSTATSGSRVPVAGWESNGSFTIVQYGIGGFPADAESARIGGGEDFFAGGPGSPVATASQTVDVSAAAEAIDAGRAEATIAAHIGGFSTQADNGTVAGIYRDAGGAELGRQTLGPVTPVDRGSQTRLEPRSATGDVPTGTRSIEVVMTATRFSGTANDGYIDNLSLSLAFDPPPDRTLTVTTAGVGSVTSVPAGIDCGSDCSETVPEGTDITLTAAPADGRSVGGWTGCDSVAGPTCEVTLNADRAVAVTFTPAPPPSLPPPPPVGADLRLTLTSTTAQVGEEAVVEAAVANVGLAAAESVRLDGWPPAQVYAVDSSGGSCDLGESGLSCALGALSAGATAQVRLRLSSQSPGGVPVLLTASSRTPDLQPADNVAEALVEFTAVPPSPVADVAVELSGPAARPSGSSATFTGVIRNLGPEAAPAVSVQGVGGAGLAIASATPARGSCTVAVDARCEFGTLAPGEAIAVTVVGRMPTLAAGLARPALLMSVSAEALDPVAANDTAGALVQFAANATTPCLYFNPQLPFFQAFNHCANIGLRIESDVPAANPGDVVAFRTTANVVDWSSHGPGSITVLNELPEGVELVSATSPAGSCTAAAILVTCDLVRPGDPLVVDVRVRVRSAQPVVNTATISAPALLLTPRVQAIVKTCGVTGTDAAESLRGRFPGDVVCGGGGADSISMPFSGVAHGGDGDDVLTLNAPGVASGGDGDDTLIGSDGDDTLSGGSGDDRVEGRGGDDRLDGGDGDDTLLAGDRAGKGDLALGGAGADTIQMTGAVTGISRAEGGPGSDHIVGGARSRILGGDGSDSLTGLPGAADVRLEGQGGNDRLVGGTSSSGGDGNDTLVGDTRDQFLSGDAGDDAIAGAGGQDTIDGGPGDDRIAGGLGADEIDAGPGHDVVDGDDAGRTRVPDGVATNDTILGGDGRDILRGGPGRDTIDGGPVDDTIEGGGGSNVLRGGDGSDRITGGPLADLIEAGNGHDRVFGGGASDHISGGAGKDELHGEAGLDRIFGGPGRDVIVPGGQADVVDALDGEVDSIVCDASPSPVDGPFLVDRNDSASRCRSRYTHLVEANGALVCIYPIAWTSVDLTYRWSNLRGGHELHGTSSQPSYGQFYWRSPGGAGSLGDGLLDVIAEREGLTLTRTYRFYASAPMPNCPPMNSDGGIDPQSDVEEID